MTIITRKSHDIKTKIKAVEYYRNYKCSVVHVCLKYHISKASLMRWNKLYDGTIDSLKEKSRRPHTPHPNSHTEAETTKIINLIKRNPNIGLTELYSKLRTSIAYSRHYASLYRYLVKLGYSVTVFEAFHTEGGVLVYGIPEFRLPKSIVKGEVDKLTKLGVEFMPNTIIGKTLDIDDLFEMGYEAVFVGSGAGLPNFMGINGETYKGVYSANEFLTRSNLMKAYEVGSHTPIMRGKNVAVVGGGNVAMDAARTALRLGADKVMIVYRRSMEELPARREEVENAIEEGIEFNLLVNPVEISAYNNLEDKRDPKNGFVKSLTCVRMELGEPDEKGRRRPVKIENSEFEIPVDTVIMAIGTSPNPLIKDTTKGLDVNKWGGIIVNDGGATTRLGVYAGGDAVTGASTVISAMGAGKTAAKSIDEYIKNK